MRETKNENVTNRQNLQSGADMRKHIVFLTLIALIIAVLSQGCSNSDTMTQAEKIGIDIENYPRIDGSTSALPIIQELYKAMHTPEVIDGVETWKDLPMEVSKTIESYCMLIDSSVDMIIVPDPPESIKQFASENNVEFEYIPICNEALVFIVNAETGINDATTAQIKSIYIDRKIDNWSQLGDKDMQIQPLTRNNDSGSYALLEKFILDGEKVHEQIEEYNMVLSMLTMVDEIETLVSMGESKHNYLSIGFTLYYFFENNKAAKGWDNVKMLNIDGVEPNRQTIASGEYAFTTSYYAVIRKDTPEDSGVRRICDWLLTAEGQDVFARAGFGGIGQ